MHMGCRMGAESPVRICAQGTVPDLKRTAGTAVDDCAAVHSPNSFLIYPDVPAILNFYPGSCLKNYYG